MRLTPGRHQTSVSNIVSKVLKILLVFVEGKCRTKVSGYEQMGNKGQVDHCLGLNHMGSC